MKRMSCSLTTDAVRDRRKFVTRRDAGTWVNLTAGDRVALIEKGMGLPKGATQVVLAEVEIVDVRLEKLTCILLESGGAAAEGFADRDERWFVQFWLDTHHKRGTDPDTIEVRRIEWRYLDGDRQAGGAT